MELISRADAIKDVESWVAVDEHERHLQKNVIEWLKEFPPAEHGTNLAEVGTDCISRQAAIDAVYKCNDIFVGDMPVMVVKADAYEALAQLPPIQPKRGKWFYQNGMIKCDQCLRAIRRIDHDGILNFCPNCGVDMRGEQE